MSDERWFEEGLRLLQSLVRLPSLSGDEHHAQALLASFLVERGYHVELHESSLNSSESSSTIVNVEAVQPGSCDGRSVLLNSHMDVVRPGLVDDWDRDPFSGDIANGRLHGRGSADAKGPLVSFVMALEKLRADGIALAGDVHLHSVSWEERGGYGTQATLSHVANLEAAIVGEPTSLAVCCAGRGYDIADVTIRGSDSHPGAGVGNIIHIAVGTLNEIIAGLAGRLDHTNSHPLWSDGPSGHTTTVTSLRSQAGVSTPATEVRFRVLVGLVPGDDIRVVRATLEDMVMASIDRQTVSLAETPRFELIWIDPPAMPIEIEAGHPVAMEFLKAARTVGISAEPRCFRAASDGQFLARTGLPIIQFGPGELTKAHTCNEYVVVADLKTAAECVASFLVGWCGAA